MSRMASASVSDLLEIDPDREDLPADPPRDADGRLVCARVCENGNRCGYPVGIPWMSCYSHDLDDPITSPESESE